VGRARASGWVVIWGMAVGSRRCGVGGGLVWGCKGPMTVLVGLLMIERGVQSSGIVGLAG